MTVSVVINSKEIQAEAGMTILEAARLGDVYIPTLCNFPGLPPAGACRMCVVEVENIPGFPTACTVPISEGMVIHTEPEAVQNLRREILSLILSEHPYTCLVCESGCDEFQTTVRKAAVTTGCQYCPANGQCELQNLVDYLGLEDMPYPITYRGLPVEQDDPFFDRDYNLCILCGRCVRVCQEVRHNGVLAFVNRGPRAIVGTAFGRPHLEVDCQFCGACVDVCPTGALSDKRGKWEGVPTDVVSSVCSYCSVGCAVDMQVKHNRLIRAVGRDEDSTNDGQLCVRGRFGMVDVVHSLTRLQSPLVRRNDRLVEVSWDEALDVAAQNLGQVEAEEFALVASATATNEESYTLQRFARGVMGSNNIALAAGFPDHENTDELVRTLAAISGPTIRSVRDASCIMAIGTNPFESHPILGLEIRHALNRGASLITVDARQTRMAERSTLWLQPKIATDHVLLAGIIKALANAGWPVGQGEYPDLDKVTQITGVDRESIVAAARQLAESLGQNGERLAEVVIIYGSGVTHHPTAMQVINAIHCLASLLGRTGVIGVPGEGNFVGAHDMGVHPRLLPGYHSVTSEPGQSYESILDGIRSGEIRALYLAGEMPPMAELADLDFLVVQDIVSTEAMQYADVVFPATTFAEMDGTLTNLEGRVQRVRQAISPVGLSRPGWMIVRDLAQRMAAESWDYQSAGDVMDEIARLIPAYAAASYDTLDEAGTLRRFETAEEVQSPELSLDGIPHFADDQFPLTLVTERNLFYYHGACLTEQVRGMNLVKPEEILYLNPADINQLGVSDGALVKVVSPFGSVECIVHQADGMIPQGLAFASFNRANGSSLFPALAPGAKAYAIRVEAD